MSPVRRSCGQIYIALNANMWAAQFILVLATCFVAIKGQCSVTVNNDLPAPQPLVLNPGLGGGFRYPDDNVGTLIFSEGENVRLVCLGTNNKFVNPAITQADVLATCVSGKIFSVSGVLIEFSKLDCSCLPTHTQRTWGTCLDRYTNVQLGFDLGSEFLTIINACHAEIGAETLYTEFTLVKEIRGGQKTFPRPSWTQGIFWPRWNLDTQYKKETQTGTIGTVLGSTALAERYIKRDHYFARGHLVAKSDFVYGAQHRVTFYYVNSAPQWQVINNGNWYCLEKNVQNFASSTYQDLTVYTGVHGIAQLRNVEEVQTDLYFYADSDGNRTIPIPKFFWKIIYHESTRRATAFIGVNNPYLSLGANQRTTSDYYLCPDISSKISWLTWKSKTVARGISYACTVDSLREVVSNIPSFEVIGLLL